MKNYRNINGTYAPAPRITLKKFLSIFILMGGTVLATMSFLKPETISYEQPLKIFRAEAAEKRTLESKILELKEEVVNKLAEQCESKDSEEPDALIIFDSNKKPSIGAWQFQRATVQHYVKLFENRDITLKEATDISMNHEAAHDLAMRIIFEDEKGIKNWLNCSNRLGLQNEVDWIKKLSQ